MAREIIVLDAVQEQTGVNLTISFVCWLTAPASRVIPVPGFNSRVPSNGSVTWGTTTAEVTALQSGSIVESFQTVILPVASLTTAICEAAVQARFTSLQNSLNAQVFSTTHFVGASFDGTTWTAGP